MRKDKGGRGGGKRDRREIRRKLALHGGFEYRPTPTGWLHHRHRLHLLRPTSCLSTPRILHLQGGVTFKTLPVLDYPMPLSLSLLLFFCLPLTHFFLPLAISFLHFYNSLRSINRIIIIPESVQFLDIARRPFEKSLSSSHE